MDPQTATAAGGLLAKLADLVSGNKAAKNTIALLQQHLSLMKDQISALEKERDDLKLKIADISIVRDSLAEKLAVFEIAENFQLRDRLLWKKDNSGSFTEGPYCPNCRDVLMSVPPQYADPESLYIVNASCPKCKYNTPIK